jgi:hypothetical protein
MIAATEGFGRVGDRFFDSLPEKPYCSDDLRSGTVIRKKNTAIKKRYIQINDPTFVRYLIFDVDREFGVWSWESAGLPHPGWAVANSSNGYAHLVYPLKFPICRSNAARIKPLRYLAAIENAYLNRLGADPGYSGLLSKNPFNEFWGVTLFDGSIAYDLATLADWIELKPHTNGIEAVGLGRNCTLFDSVRHWAYREIQNYWEPGGAERWNREVLLYSLKQNNFHIPLPVSEIRSVAKSIASWTWKRITPAGKNELVMRTHAPEIQSKKGKENRKRSRSDWDSLISRNVPESPFRSRRFPQG